MTPEQIAAIIKNIKTIIEIAAARKLVNITIFIPLEMAEINKLHFFVTLPPNSSPFGIPAFSSDIKKLLDLEVVTSIDQETKVNINNTAIFSEQNSKKIEDLLKHQSELARDFLNRQAQSTKVNKARNRVTWLSSIQKAFSEASGLPFVIPEEDETGSMPIDIPKSTKKAGCN